MPKPDPGGREAETPVLHAACCLFNPILSNYKEKGTWNDSIGYVCIKLGSLFGFIYSIILLCLNGSFGQVWGGSAHLGEGGSEWEAHHWDVLKINGLHRQSLASWKY